MRVSVADPCLIARLYQEPRERVIGLVTGLDDAAWSTAVAACPGWSVRDVVAHMVAVAEDWARGRWAGPPTDEEAAAQIALFGDYDVAEILAACTGAAHSWTTWPKPPGWHPRSATSPVMSTTSAVPSAARGTGFRRGLVFLRPAAHEPSAAGAAARDGGRRPVSERTRRPSRNTATHYAIRSPALANGPPQPRPARRHGLVGRPNSGTRSPVHVRPG